MMLWFDHFLDPVTSSNLFRIHTSEAQSSLTDPSSNVCASGWALCASFPHLLATPGERSPHLKHQHVLISETLTETNRHSLALRKVHSPRLRVKGYCRTSDPWVTRISTRRLWRTEQEDIWREGPLREKSKAEEAIGGHEWELRDQLQCDKMMNLHYLNNSHYLCFLTNIVQSFMKTPRVECIVPSVIYSSPCSHFHLFQLNLLKNSFFSLFFHYRHSNPCSHLQIRNLTGREFGRFQWIVDSKATDDLKRLDRCRIPSRSSLPPNSLNHQPAVRWRRARRRCWRP